MGDGSLRIRYLDPGDGEWKHESFDMVVLSTGQEKPVSPQRLAAMIGLDAPPEGLDTPQGFEKVRSSKPGIFLCGSLLGLTDISEALTAGSAAAGEASKLLHQLGKPYEVEVALPPERPVARERPRVHVLLCRCGDNRASQAVDFALSAQRLRAIPGVGQVDVVDTLCRGDGFASSEQLLRHSKCNRVVFAACMPYIYRRRLRAIAEKAGFNPALVEVVDWLSLLPSTSAEGQEASLMRQREMRVMVGIEKLKATDPVPTVEVAVYPRVLVVGGGVAGMRAALSLAQRGIGVGWVESRGELGGRVRQDLHYTLDGLDPRGLVEGLMQAVRENPRIQVHTETRLSRTQGTVGRFRSVLEQGEKRITIEHGATIVATGGKEAGTTLYGYGSSERVMTQSEVEKGLSEGSLDAAALDTVVMIQCVGSREPGAHNYCSRVCCAAALKNANQLRKANPQVRIVILYRDMMTYGFLESYYTEARRQGVLFASYDPADKPRVQFENGKPVVTFTDTILRDEVRVSADLLCLSTGVEPDPSHQELGEKLGIALTQDGFFQEAESKWRPVDCLKEGVFLAGLAHSPRPIVEVLAQAEAAAQRAFVYLSKGRLTAARMTSKVHDSLCARCRTCITACPFEARSYDVVNHRVTVDAATCQGCGICAVACPNGAAELKGPNDRQNLAIIEASLMGSWSAGP